MTDLFGDWVPDAWLDRIFAVMALTPQHTHLVLTKHSKRMRDYVDKLGRAWILRLSHAINAVPELIAAADRPGRETPHWPLPNVHFGVTAEDQPRADERIPNLLATPAAIRFVSAEPLLADIDFTSLPSVSGIGRHLDALSTAGAKFSDLPGRIDQIITGGETGPRARGTPIAAFRSIRDQCAAAGVAYFHKHNGEWIDADEWYDLVDQGAVEIVTRFGRLRGHVCDGRGAFADWAPARPLNFEDAEALAEITGVRRLEHQSDGTTLLRVGARRAGRALGGRVYDEFPEPRR
jgi:protein gp37